MSGSIRRVDQGIDVVDFHDPAQVGAGFEVADAVEEDVRVASGEFSR